MKRSKCLLISAILGTLYLFYIISYFFNGVASTSGGEQIGAGIATALVAPHMFLLALAVLFNWIGWAARVRWAALTGGILYCVSGSPGMMISHPIRPGDRSAGAISFDSSK